MTDKLIKNVNVDLWKKLRQEAIVEELTVGQMLEVILNQRYQGPQ